MGVSKFVYLVKQVESRDDSQDQECILKMNDAHCFPLVVLMLVVIDSIRCSEWFYSTFVYNP